MRIKRTSKLAAGAVILMKICKTLGFVLALSSQTPSGLAATVVVDGNANIFGASHSSSPAPDGGGSGGLPVQIALSTGAGQVLSISAVTGSVYYGTGPEFVLSDADGNPNVGVRDVASYGGISGVISPYRYSLYGVFLTNSEASDAAPARLNFTTGSSTAFTSLAPLIGQTFFIGDGLTGSGSGSTQMFYVPDTATRLFLGFVDNYNDGSGPGAFDDNGGSFTVTYAVTPEPSKAVFICAGCCFLLLHRRKLKQI